MAAPRPINRSFEQFLGVDRERSPLTTDRLFARTATNARLIDNHLTVRPGSKPVAMLPKTDTVPLGIHTYTFEDSDTRGTTEKLITLKFGVDAGTPPTFTEWEKTSPLTITYSGGGTGTVSIIPIEDNWQVTLKEDGTPVAGWPKTYGDGLDISDDVWSDLSSDINGEADWAATGSFAGTDSIIGVLPYLVDEYAGSGLTLEVYDELTLTDTNYQLEYHVFEYTPYLAGYKHPSFLNKRNVCYVAFGYYLCKWDGNQFYRAGMPSHIASAYTVSGTAGSLTGDYQYFIDFLRIDDKGNRIRSQPGPLEDITLSSQDGVIAYSSLQTNRVLGDADGAQSGLTITYNIRSQAFSYLPEVNDHIYVLISTGKAVVRRITAITEEAGKRTYTFDSSVIVSNSQEIFLYNENFSIRGAQVNGAQSGVTTVTVDSGHTFVAGDIAFFENGETREVDSVTATTIVVDEEIDVDDNDFISNNIRTRIWRTTNGGEIFYLAAEVPNPFDVTSRNYTDDMVDGTLELQEVWEEPLKTPAQPPKCSVLTEHQNLTITGGDPDNPNTFAWEDIEILESFPVQNAADIPSTVKGGITALGSESNILSVCKRTSHFPIHGDLDSGVWEVGQFTEGDIGVESHNSLKLVDKRLIGLGPRCPVEISRGVISDQIGRPLIPDFRGQFYIQSGTLTSAQESLMVLRRAQAINDFRERLYILYVPAEEGVISTTGDDYDDVDEDQKFPSGNGKYYVWDDYKKRWFDMDLPQDLNAYCGFTIYEDLLHWLSMTGTNKNTLVWREPNSSSKYDFVDNVEAITWDIWLQHEGTSKPELLKQFQALKFYMFNVSNFYAFDLRVRTYREFDETTAQTDVTISFSATTDIEKAVDLAMDSARVMQIRLTVSGYAERPLLTGYAFQAGLPHGEEELDLL